MINTLLALVLGSIGIFLSWAVVTAGLGTRFNAIALVAIIIIVAALAWNSLQNKQTLLLLILSIIGLVVCFDGWVYFVSRSASIVHTADMDELSLPSSPLAEISRNGSRFAGVQAWQKILGKKYWIRSDNWFNQ